MHTRLLFPILACSALAACVLPPGNDRIVRNATTAFEGDAAEHGKYSGTGSFLSEELTPNGTLALGAKEAPNTFMVFLNMRCSYCRMFLTDFLPELEREFVTPGTLRIEIVLVPLKKYSDSYDRALQLLCAIKQEKGRSMLEALANLSREDATPVTLQKRLGLDATLWRTCLQDPVTRTMVEAETALGTSLHVSLLPTFFLNGERHIGLPELADLLGLIRPLQEP